MKCKLFIIRLLQMGKHLLRIGKYLSPQKSICCRFDCVRRICEGICRPKKASVAAGKASVAEKKYLLRLKEYLSPA